MDAFPLSLTETLMLATLAGMVIWPFLAKRLWPVAGVRAETLAERLAEERERLVLDVRTEAEFREVGHIAGSLNLPLGDLAERLQRAGAGLGAHRDTPVTVVCATGARAEKAGRRLKKAGFTRVDVLTGGLRAWQKAGLPLA